MLCACVECGLWGHVHAWVVAARGLSEVELCTELVHHGHVPVQIDDLNILEGPLQRSKTVPHEQLPDPGAQTLPPQESVANKVD